MSCGIPGTMKLIWPRITILVACVYAEVCRPGQTRFGGSCYQILAGEMDWKTANTTCSGLGGGLAVPDNLDEHWFIWKMFTGSVAVGELWIGCAEVQVDGYLVWPGQEGHDCSYVNWAQNQPSHHEGERCVEMRRQFNGSCNDRQCIAENYGVCEWAAGPFSNRTTYCMKSNVEGRFVSPCLSGHVIKELPVKSIFACGWACWEEPLCRSFNVRETSRGNKTCELNSVRREAVADIEKLLDEIDTCYYFDF